MEEWIGGRPRLFVVFMLLTVCVGREVLLLLLRKIVKITRESHTDISDCLDS